MPATTGWNQTGSSRCALVVIIAVLAISLACAGRRSKSDSAATSNIDRSPALMTDKTDKKVTDSSTPDVAEVQAALARVYQDTVTIDRSQSEPVLLGDFNGDGSPDLAVIVRPTSEGSLPKLNSEYANWIVEDPNN